MADNERIQVHLSEPAEFQDFLRDNQTVIVRAHATWCKPCKMVQPLFDACVEELPKCVSIVHLDIDKAPSVSRKLSIRSVPCFISFYQGQPYDVSKGSNPVSVKSFFNKVKNRLGMK